MHLSAKSHVIRQRASSLVSAASAASLVCVSRYVFKIRAALHGTGASGRADNLMEEGLCVKDSPKLAILVMILVQKGIRTVAAEPETLCLRLFFLIPCIFFSVERSDP